MQTTQASEKTFLRRQLTPVKSLALSFLFLSSTVQLGFAQEKTNADVQTLLAGHRAIGAARLQWSVVRTVHPNPNADVDKAVESVTSQLRQRGKSKIEIEGYADATRISVRQSADGFTQSSSLVLTRIQGKLRGDVMQNAPISNGVSASKEVAQFIDSYDGRNLIEINGIGVNPRLSGSVTHSPTATLPHSAPSLIDLHFLAASPIPEFLNAKDTVVKEVAADQIVLEKRVQKEYPALLRISISGKAGRASDFEEINTLDGRTLVRYRAEEFRPYSGGIYFPHRVTLEAYGATTIYTLKKATFNDSVDPTELRLPPNVSIDDYRFETAVRYPLRDGKLPSDLEVQRLQQVAAKEVDPKEDPQQVASFPLFQGLGLVCLACGLMLWTRAKKNE